MYKWEWDIINDDLSNMEITYYAYRWVDAQKV